MYCLQWYSYPHTWGALLIYFNYCGASTRQLHQRRQYQTLPCHHGSMFDGRNPVIQILSCNKTIYTVDMFSYHCVATLGLPSFACYPRLNEPMNSVVPCSNSYEIPIYLRHVERIPNLGTYKYMRRCNIPPQEDWWLDNMQQRDI